MHHIGLRLLFLHILFALVRNYPGENYGKYPLIAIFNIHVSMVSSCIRKISNSHSVSNHFVVHFLMGKYPLLDAQ